MLAPPQQQRGNAGGGVNILAVRALGHNLCELMAKYTGFGMSYQRHNPRDHVCTSVRIDGCHSRVIAHESAVIEWLLLSCLLAACLQRLELHVYTLCCNKVRAIVYPGARPSHNVAGKTSTRTYLPACSVSTDTGAGLSSNTGALRGRMLHA